MQSLILPQVDIQNVFNFNLPQKDTSFTDPYHFDVDSVSFFILIWTVPVTARLPTSETLQNISKSHDHAMDFIVQNQHQANFKTLLKNE